MASCPKCRKTFADTLTTCPDDGEVLVPDLHSQQTDIHLKRGDTVGEYVIEAQIGSGTFGDVYRAIQPLIGKQVAIKILARKYSADPHIVSRFIAEARAVNQIRHKHIIDIFSFGQLPDGRHYHIMELLQGGTLDLYLKERGRIAPAEVIPILQSLGRALDAAHAAGIAHRDLKPANVFLAHDEDGKPFPKLLDFGIAKLMSDDVPRHHQTATGAAVGTPDYMSPEQCQGPNVDHRTDIYAFGVMTYQLLTGRLPFIGANVVDVLVKQMTATPDPPSTVYPALPKSLDRPILWMLEKDKDNRPPNLATAIRALEQGAISAGISVLPSSSTGDPAATPPLGMAPRVPRQELPVAAFAANTVPNEIAAGATDRTQPSNPPLTPSVLSDTLPSSAARALQESGELEKAAPPPREKKRGILIATLALIAAIPAAAFLSWNRNASEERQERAQEKQRADDDPAVVTATKSAIAQMVNVNAAPPATATVAAKPVEVKAAEPDMIELRIDGEPKGAEVYGPGGVLLCKSPCSVRLPRGTDKLALELRAPGYLTQVREIVPIADGAITMELAKKKTVIKPLKKAPKSDDLEDAFK